MDITERLFKLQQLIESAKARKHEAEGAIKNLKSQLKSQFGLDTIDEAKEFLVKTQADIDKLEKQVISRLTKLEEMVAGKG